MAESRSKKSAKNMMAGFLYQALILILSFISRTVFIYALGTEYLGLNGIFADVIQLLSMADLGFGTAMAYSFYKPLAEHDEARIRALVNFYRNVYRIIACAVLMLGLLCIPFLPMLVNTQEKIQHLTLYYLFSLAGVVISYLFVYKTTLMTADQKNYKLVRIQMWTSTAKTLLQILLLVLWKNYIVYLIIGVATQFLNNLISSRMTEKEYPYLLRKEKNDKVRDDIQKSIIMNMKSVFVYKFSSILFTATDNILISIITGTAMVGLYSNYLMVSNKLLLIEQIVFSSLTASVGNVIVKECCEKRFHVFQAMQSASFIFCGIITSCFCLLVNDLICVWLGKPFQLSLLTVVAISLNTYFSCVLQPLWIYRDATGLYKKTKYVMLAGAIMNIILSLLLGKMIGIAGIIGASAISRICTYFWYEPRLLYREYFQEKVTHYFLSILWNLLLVIGVVGICYAATSKIAVNNWGILIIKAFVIGIVCCVVFLCAYARTDGFQILMRKAKQLLTGLQIHHSLVPNKTNEGTEK